MNPYATEPGQSNAVPPSERLEQSDNEIFNPDANSVSLGSAFTWYSKGFDQFKASPGIWIGLVVLFIVITLVVGMIPFLGSIINIFLGPIFFAGLMLACEAQRRGQAVGIDHLFQGFGKNGGALALFGLLSLAFYIVIGIVVLIVVAMSVGGAAISGMFAGGHPSAALLGMGIGTMALCFLIAMLAFVPIMMAMWFGPTLIVLHDVAPFDALKMGLRGAFKNWFVFILYMLLYMIFAIFATIPIFLGWFVLGPVLIGAFYAAYREIYITQ